jgi:hypothetical protein
VEPEKLPLDFMKTGKYTVIFRREPPEMQGLWEGSAWQGVDALEIACFRPEGSDHYPFTRTKMLYDLEKIYVIFRVDDRYVRCTSSGFQTEVYKDSCVEFFVQPCVGKGYFNFEFNCGGTLLASYVTDPTRVDGRVKEFTPLTAEDDRLIYRYSSLPAIVEPEIADKLVWLLEFSIPLVVLEKYAGSLGDVGGQIWKANFYKCGNETSYPHWGAWSSVSALNFHTPADFGFLHFLRPDDHLRLFNGSMISERKFPAAL